MKNKGLLVAFLAVMALCSAKAFSADTPSASDILARSDEIRNPQADYSLDVKITSVKPGRADALSSYEVLVSGRDRTIVRTLTPPIDRGRVILMLGKDLWAYLPNLAKPLRISLRERLTGDVANGDIARANFVGDYTPELVRTEDIDGKTYLVLELKANAEDVTYSKVMLWLEKDTDNPLKAEFYAVSGRLLKTCSYEDFREFGGEVRPTRVVMMDAVVKGQQSVLEYSNIDIKPIPEKYFTKDYMKKLSD
ncbi:MAG: outer membrane lipoprotein-sorting protein [Candidatus Omnitrophica bacterium]|nr:outer membrane lipoprotein-sorting protein [Candidatus Omnitrophota bacterium]